MINQVIISAAGLGLASLLGSVAGLVVKRVSHKWNDVFLGFCAGMMLAASIAGLDRKSTRLNSSHPLSSRMPSSA